MADSVRSKVDTGRRARPMLAGDLEWSMRVIRQGCAAVLLWSSIGAASAQAPTPVPQQTTVERQVRAVANRDTQIGIYLNVLPDCTSGPLPTIRLVTSPAAGKVVVKTANAKTTNYKACLALEVPAYVAFHKAPPEFLGDDSLTIEVKYHGGRTEIHKITVNVSGPGGRQKI
ncbi:hypothetical protein [uncultured Bradyrhizobium sp.]|uniref:hypothetical protein n=1 Tax=Bradyrhizobium sp. TaxID=376 RepID=UPI0026019AA3|nr:hypothetical protein [uncultured Bradyrhizobium sp.]